MRVALLHLGHSMPLAVSIILERSAVLATFAMVYVSSNRLRATRPPEPLSTRFRMIWGETEGAASYYFTRKIGLPETAECNVFSRPLSG
jgi:hypothetical protein